jgi:CAAX protease family protein
LETNHIKLKTVGLSIAAILMVEWLTAMLRGPAVESMVMVGIDRFLEILILLGIGLWAEPDGLKALGILPARFRQGLFRGLRWSLGFGLVALLAAVVLKLAGIHPVSLISANLPQSKASLLLFFLVGGLISPVAEEIFFRGVLYGYFRRWGVGTAVGGSTLLFVLAHSASRGIPLPQIVGGLLFAIAYEKEKNLLVPVTIHVLGNMAIYSVSLL